MFDFSEFVKKKREETGLPQHRFADKIGVPWMTIWRWENGSAKPGLDAIKFWVDKISKIEVEK